MKNFIVVFLLLLSFQAFSQNTTNPNMKVEMTRDAAYPEGDKALYTYIFQNLKYSDEAKANKVSGDVMISFWVEADSTLTNIKTITDPGYGVGENMKALLANIKYVPALINGVPMRSKVMITVPVRAH